MIQLDKRIAASMAPTGTVTAWKTQAVLLPNHFFLNPTIRYDWDANTCELNNSTYYLDKVLDKQDTLIAIPSEAEWLNTYGNTIKHTYYEGMSSGNPSGNTRNIKRSSYIDSLERTKYIFEYTWDVNDNCVSQKSLAPTGAESQADVANYKLRVFNNGDLIKELIVQDDLLVFLDSSFIKPVSPNPNRYEFAGYSCPAAGENLSITHPYGPDYDIWTVRMKGNYDVVVVWDELVYVDIVSESGERYDRKKLRKGGEFNLSILEQWVPADTEGFLGWYVDNVKVVADSTIIVNSDTSIVAKFQSEEEEGGA